MQAGTKPPITTAVICANGYSTRRLPITAAIPKDFTPIGNRPAIDYVVDNLVDGGITDIYFVIPPHHHRIYERYYIEYPELDDHLNHKGSAARLAELKRLRSRANFKFIQRDVEPDRYGDALPLAAAMERLGNTPCIYASSDDFTIREDGGSDIGDLLAGYAMTDTDTAMLGAEMPLSQLSHYGVLEIENRNGHPYLKNLVEKPSQPQNIPMPRLVNISRYIINEAIFPFLSNLEPNPATGEYYITDVMNRVIRSNDVLVVPARGEYYDVGTLEKWLIANQKLAHDQL